MPHEKILNAVKQAALTMQRYNWEQGVAAQAFLEAGDAEMAILMAVEGVHRQTADGRCSQIGEPLAATDPCAVGEALVYACEQTQEPDLLRAKDKLLCWALSTAPRNADGLVYHLCDRREIWVDSMYMLPPFLARAGYYDEALRQLNGYWGLLWNPENGLMAHRWDDGEKRFVRKAAWGVGNGWAAAGMARVRSLLPAYYKDERQQIAVWLRKLLETVVQYQRTDGLFHNVLDDSSTFPEVNAGQMFAYTIYRGVGEGWLDYDLLPAAERARMVALNAVDRYGIVCNVCGAPDFDSPGSASEAQSFLILMEAARAACAAL